MAEFKKGDRHVMNEVTTSGPSNGACLDCHRRYGDEHGFPDLIVPDNVWEAINPGSDGGGLLCPSCICARAYRAGVRAVAYFASGPFEHVNAPAEDHGTGDGSAPDICAEPGCNYCDLERRFPAPLDPKAVKAGDTVTVTIAEYGDTPEFQITGPVYCAGHGLGDLVVGDYMLMHKRVTLTAHTPAPEPEEVMPIHTDLP
jgi:hypothetical protein